ncbi:ABC transporter permease subunit [Paenibacillus sp. GCM10027626]|uniref:ABC transporter permease subunit n=1 Tax=Paenibacillus sp. GCM10027626 TaxID=3273411 RepID=UPI00363C337F
MIEKFKKANPDITFDEEVQSHDNYAAMQSISSELYEMAEIDGATGFKKMRHITLPLLSPTIKIAVMLCIAGNMKAFDSIFVMTGGGPGSSSTNTVLRIVLPLCLPVISTAIILFFLGAWNEFPFALVLIKSAELRTLPLGLTNFNGQYTANYTQMLAAMVIVVLPVIVVYLAFAKKVMQGMTAGAVKG